MNDGDLFRRKDALANSIFAIALTKRATLPNRHRNQEPKSVTAKNGGKTIALAPNTVFMVAQNNDPRLGLKRIEIFITFDRQNTHCRNGFWGAFLAKCLIFAQSDFAVCVEMLNAALFL